MSRKIKRRKKKSKNTSEAVVDLVDLNNLFAKSCAKALENGETDKVSKIIDFMKAIKTLQKKELTYERAFILNHLERHGLLGDNLMVALNDCPLSKEEAEELKKIFGNEIESIKLLTE